jgi:signal transduction histidine kinase
MTAVRSEARRSAIPSTVIRLSVGLACAVLGILVTLGLDQVVAVAPWLVVTFAVGLLAAILGGILGGSVAAVLGTLGQVFAIPAWVPAVARLGGANAEVHAGSAILALVAGLWIRNLVLRSRPAPGPRLPGGARVDAGHSVTSVPVPSGANERPARGVDQDPIRPAAATIADLEVVSRAVQDFAAARTPAQVADALARHAAGLSGASGATVYLGRDGADGYLPLGRHGRADPGAPERLGADHTRLQSIGPTGRARTARPATTRALVTVPSAGASAAAGRTSSDGAQVVECRIGSGTATYGVLRLNGDRNGARPRPGVLVDVLLQVAADALERGQLRTTRRAAEGDAAGALGRVRLLARLAAALVGGTTVNEAARTLVDLAVDDHAAGIAGVHVPDHDSGQFRLVRARGYPAGLLARDDTIPASAITPVTQAAHDRSIVEVSGEDGWREAFPTASNVPAITGVRMITAIPMQTAAAVQGVLTIGWRVATDRARADLDLVAIVADQGAQALERALLHAHDEDARRFQEAFIGVVSHELRTPITTIVAGSRLLRRRVEAGSPAAELTDDIEVEADRLSRIVDDLLVLSRLERRHLTIGDEPVHLDHLLARVLRSESARWPDHQFSVRSSAGSHVVVGDETYVEQVLRNLISNAAKYSPVGSPVQLVLDDSPDGEVHVGVLDEGPGVAPAEVDDLFSLFYRSPSTAASAAGAGIGLFVSRRLVAEMGGRMWARPRPGGGSEFGFSLERYPIDEAELDELLPEPTGDRPSRPAADEPAETSAGR